LPKAASLAERLLSVYKTKIEELTLQPSSGGRFEVSVDDKLIYSKAETRSFPAFEEIQQKLTAS